MQQFSEEIKAFIIPLQVMKLSGVHIYCVKNGPDVGNSSINLQIFCPALNAYNEHHHQLRHDIQSAEENIYRMLQGNNPLRAKIAILGFVGRFAKSLFGVSTEEDTSILAKQIQTLQNLGSENQEDLMMLFDYFQSYIVKQNKNFELLQNTTLLNHEALTFISSLMKKTIDSQQELA